MNDHSLLHPPSPESDITLRRFLVFLAAAIFVTLVIVSAMILYFYSHSFPCPQCQDRQFSSDVWKNPPDDVTRVQMVNDLLENHNPVGLTREMAEVLLGTLSSHGWNYPGCDHTIWLGREKSIFPLDSIYLCLSFENNVVVAARVVEG